MQRLFRRFGWLATVLLTVSGCASLHPNHDDLIKIDVQNAAPVEEEAFKYYFRAYINNIVDDDYVGPPVASRSAKFTLKITVESRSGEPVDMREHRETPAGVEASGPIFQYSYRIRLDLIRNQDKQLVWTWRPDRWMAYPEYKKSIKWLAKYSAKRLYKKGFLDDQYFE